VAFLNLRRSSRLLALPAALLALLALLAPRGLEAEEAGTPVAPVEYQVKAAFLFNFTKFVEWPDDVFPENGPLRLCIVGADPFGASLENIVRGEAVNGRPLTIDRNRQLTDLSACHLLFVSRSERGRLREIFEAVHGDSVLTVGDSPGFLAAGGMIELTLEGSKVRFAIDREKAERSRLKISSKLLRLAVNQREDRR
jgi:hypothetical protein